VAERIIEVTIDETGDTQLNLIGFKGKGCKDVAKAFEKMGKVKSETIKAEYHEGPGGSGVQVGR
jgi:hypothetical protein